MEIKDMEFQHVDTLRNTSNSLLKNLYFKQNSFFS